MEKIVKEGKLILHISPSIFREKIKRQGLIPKSKSKAAYHPERIYFIISINNSSYLTMTKSLAKQLYNLSSDEIKNSILLFSGSPSFDIWELDLSKTQSIKFLKDPNFPGCYTLENIPVSALKLLDTFEL